ncbi:MAG: Hpt domain-containing protein [Rubripirellula sp.]|nr:Hpt domain-containing protein [Rubripirellula sp.]
MPFPSIDLKRLQSEIGVDDVELLVTVAQALAKEAPICLAEIERALVARNEKEVSIAAHTLKGASRMMIMERVADAAEEVELAGKRGDFEAVASTFITLRHHVEEMLQAIERFANENQAP